MANRIDYACVEVPRILHARLVAAKEHHRQSMHELVEAMLDYWEENGGWDFGARPPLA